MEIMAQRDDTVDVLFRVRVRGSRDDVVTRFAEPVRELVVKDADERAEGGFSGMSV